MTHYQHQAWSDETAENLSFLDRQLKAYISRKLAEVDIVINGSRPHDITVSDPGFYRRVLLGGSLRLGEEFQNGMWSCRDIAGMCRRLRTMKVPPIARLPEIKLRMKAAVVDLQGPDKAKQNVADHYDLSNEFYEQWLDPNMQYSCAYFDRGAKTLEQAQIDKMQLILEKLDLRPGQRVLDVGCGWGGLAAFLAKHKGVEVTGITLSEEQLAYAREKHRELIAGGMLGFHLMDYRAATAETLGKFDRIVSVGMLEHVGEEHLAAWRDKADELLKPDGEMLLHFIVGKTGAASPWIDKYVFPGGVLPRQERVEEIFVDSGIFKAWDWHFFGLSYAKTLLCWRDNFLKAWSELLQKGLPHHPKYIGGYDSPQYQEWLKRTWLFYLETCSGSFDGRFIDLCQVKLSRKSRPADFEPVR